MDDAPHRLHLPLGFPFADLHGRLAGLLARARPDMSLASVSGDAIALVGGLMSQRTSGGGFGIGGQAVLDAYQVHVLFDQDRLAVGACRVIGPHADPEDLVFLAETNG